MPCEIALPSRNGVLELSKPATSSGNCCGGREHILAYSREEGYNVRMTGEPQQDSPFELQASLGTETVATSIANPALPTPESSDAIGIELSGQNGPEMGELSILEQPTAQDNVPTASAVEPMDLEPTSAVSASMSGLEEVPFSEPCPVAGKASSDSADANGRGSTAGEQAPMDGAQGQRTQSGSQRPRKPHLQGRFSGRLETKDDEKTLQEECRQLGPLVGGLGKRGEKSRMTLAKIVRAIATGDVRNHCQDRENKIAELQEKLKTMETVYRRDIELLKQENSALRLKLELRTDDFNHRQVIITPATVPPMVVVRGGNTRYPTNDPVTSIGGGIPPVDVSSIPFLFPSAAQGHALQANSPIAGGGRVAQLSSVDAATAAQARTLAQVRSRVEAANTLNLKRKLQEMQVFPMSQNQAPGGFGSSPSGGISQQQVAFLSVPGHGVAENEGAAGVAAPAVNLLGTHPGMPAPSAQEVHTPTVALTIGDDMASQQLSQQANISGQKAVIVSNLQPSCVASLQAANAALTSTGPFASQLLSGQIGLDNVLSQIPLTEALATSTTPMVIGGNEMAPTLEDSALSTPMEAEVMDPNILEQLNAGDLDLTTVAAAVPILRDAGGGTQIVMPAASVLRMSSEAGRPVG